MTKYILKQNELTGDGKKYIAQVVDSRSYTFDDIAKHLIRHNTGLSSSAIYGLWQGIKDAVEEFIADGGSINTELFRVSTSIKGVFDGMDDIYDSSKHKIRLNLCPGSLLKDIPKKIKTRKINADEKTRILSVTDIISGSVNENLTHGKHVQILGQRVKIDGDDPSNGLYFISSKTSTQPVKIEFDDVIVNKPSQVIAVIPKLAKGTWNLKLVTQYCKGKKRLKAPHSIIYNKSLNVV